MEFQKRNNQWHWLNNTVGAKRIYEVDFISCIQWLVIVDGIDGNEWFDGTDGFGGLKLYK